MVDVSVLYERCKKEYKDGFCMSTTKSELYWLSEVTKYPEFKKWHPSGEEKQLLKRLCVNRDQLILCFVCGRLQLHNSRYTHKDGWGSDCDDDWSDASLVEEDDIMQFREKKWKKLGRNNKVFTEHRCSEEGVVAPESPDVISQLLDEEIEKLLPGRFPTYTPTPRSKGRSPNSVSFDFMSCVQIKNSSFYSDIFSK